MNSIVFILKYQQGKVLSNHFNVIILFIKIGLKEKNSDFF